LPYFFYILYSQSLDRYYYGYTSETLERRLANHLSNHSGFTGKAKDWQVAYFETYATKSEAFAREREVKAWKSRAMVQELISIK
jgi:putative endonuclease